MRYNSSMVRTAYWGWTWRVGNGFRNLVDSRVINTLEMGLGPTIFEIPK